MFDFRKPWPIEPATSYEPLVVRVILIIFLLLLLLDAPVTIAVANLPEAVRTPFFYITRLGKSDWILIPAFLGVIGGYVLGRIIWRDARGRIYLRVAAVSAFIFCGTAIPGILANLIKRTLGRARPVHFEELGIFHFAPLNWDWSFQSFPSGDTTTICAFGVTIAFLAPRFALPALVLAALVSLSRIMVGMHYPTDVYGGILLGTLGAYAIRNFCARREWLFVTRSDGLVVAKKFNASS